MNIVFSSTESKRFALPVYRTQSEILDIATIDTFSKENPAALLICRVLSHTQTELHQLNKLGLNYLLADTLLYYAYDLKHHLPKTLQNPLSFQVATQEDEPILNDLIQEIFAGYSNHYSSNPILNKNELIAGYQEWMKAYLIAKEDDKITFLVKKDQQLAGFAACRKISEELAEGVLYGVRPSFRKGGIYTDIIRYTQSFFQTKGAHTLQLSTQVQNLAAQKIWIKEGYIIKEAWLTLHIFGRELSFQDQSPIHKI